MKFAAEGFANLADKTSSKAKGLFAACLACLALVTCLCVAAPGRALAADWTVGCSAGAGTLYVGDTLTVDITATGDGIASLSGKLTYRERQGDRGNVS